MLLFCIVCFEMLHWREIFKKNPEWRANSESWLCLREQCLRQGEEHAQKTWTGNVFSQDSRVDRPERLGGSNTSHNLTDNWKINKVKPYWPLQRPRIVHYGMLRDVFENFNSNQKSYKLEYMISWHKLRAVK